MWWELITCCTKRWVVFAHCAFLAAFALLTGCVRFLEPNDPPGRYLVATQPRTQLVLYENGRYHYTRAAGMEKGRWALLTGCASGLDAIELTPDGESDGRRLPAGEGWFRDVEVYDEGLTFEKQ